VELQKFDAFLRLASGYALHGTLFGEIVLHEIGRAFSGELRLVEFQLACVAEGFESTLLLAFVVRTRTGAHCPPHQIIMG